MNRDSKTDKSGPEIELSCMHNCGCNYPSFGGHFDSIPKVSEKAKIETASFRNVLIEERFHKQRYTFQTTRSQSSHSFIHSFISFIRRVFFRLISHAEVFQGTRNNLHAATRNSTHGPHGALARPWPLADASFLDPQRLILHLLICTKHHTLPTTVPGSSAFIRGSHWPVTCATEKLLGGRHRLRLHLQSIVPRSSGGVESRRFELGTVRCPGWAAPFWAQSGAAKILPPRFLEEGGQIPLFRDLVLWCSGSYQPPDGPQIMGMTRT